jgi:hypothetical protein
MATNSKPTIASAPPNTKAETRIGQFDFDIFFLVL